MGRVKSVIIILLMVVVGRQILLNTKNNPGQIRGINVAGLVGDLDNSGRVDIADFFIIIGDFGRVGNPGFIPADIDNDGGVDIFDFNLLVTNFGSAITPTPTTGGPTATATPASTPTPGPFGIGQYGVFALVAKDQVTNAALIRSEVARVKALGVKFVGQIFGANSDAQWQVFADLMAENGMKFVPFIRDETPVFNSSTGHWDLGVHGRFIDAMKNHPALYGVFVFDEPHRHGIVASRVAILYQDAKDRADPVNLKIGIGFSGEIWRAETDQYGQNNDLFKFRPGLCDICMISGLEFRIVSGNHVYQRQDALDNHYYSRIAIEREATGVELFSTVQTFGREGTTYYLPSTTEVQDIIDIVLSDQNQSIKNLDGIMYQTWEAPEPGQDAQQDSLGDTEFVALRDVVKATAIRLGIPIP